MADVTASKVANRATAQVRTQARITRAQIAQASARGFDTTRLRARLARQQARAAQGFGTTGGIATRARLRNAGAIANAGGRRAGAAGAVAASRLAAPAPRVNPTNAAIAAQFANPPRRGRGRPRRQG